MTDIEETYDIERFDAALGSWVRWWAGHSTAAEAMALVTEFGAKNQQYRLVKVTRQVVLEPLEPGLL